MGLFVSQPFAARLWTRKRAKRQISGSCYGARLRRTVQGVSGNEGLGLLLWPVTSAFLTFNGFCTLARTERCLRLWNTSVLRDYCYQRWEAICLETRVFSARRKCTLERSAFHNFDKLPHYHTWLWIKSAAGINAVKSPSTSEDKICPCSVLIQKHYRTTYCPDVLCANSLILLNLQSFVINSFPIMTSWEIQVN